MKKTLLLSSMLVAALGLQAQQEFKLAVKPDWKVKSDPAQSFAVPVKNNIKPMPASSGSRAINKVPIGSSANAYTLLLSESTALTANQTLQTVMFTHRLNLSNLYAGGNSGSAQVAVSKDAGASWDTTGIVVSNSTNALRHRYPSGVILNPPGNTVPDSAFAVVAGPIYNGSGWSGNFFASAQLNGTKINQLETDNATASQPQDMARIGMSAGDNGAVYIAGTTYDFDAAAPDFTGTVINKGILNQTTKAIDWSTVVLNPDLVVDPNTGEKEFSTLGNTAWSQSGNTGYAVIYGRDANADFLAMQPIVFKTTDAGATWNQLPGFDFSTITTLDTMLPDIQGDTIIKPYFTSIEGMDMSVDADGNLHIATVVLGGYSNHPDSLNYYYATPYRHIFDVHMKNDNTWGAYHVGTLWTERVTDATSPWVTASYDARIQIARQSDGKRLFVLWNDSDTNFTAVNDLPDIIGVMIEPAFNYVSDPINFTAGTAYEQQNFWMFVSDVALVNVTTGEINVPVTTSTGAGTADDPMFHYYVQGINFTPSGLKEVQETRFSVSQNFPNPFDRNTAINVTVDAPAKATIAVINTLGQNVYTATRNLSSGENRVDINAEFATGMYLYTVTIGERSVTRRMMVK